MSSEYPSTEVAGDAEISSIHLALDYIAQGDVLAFDATRFRLSAGMRHTLTNLVTSIRDRVAAASVAAARDPVTGALRRVAFREDVAARLARRAAGTPAAMLFVALESTGHIDGKDGHRQEDELLALAAGRLEAALDGVKHQTGSSQVAFVVSRHATGEFAIYVEGWESEDAMRAARAVLAALREPFRSDGNLKVDVSIGVAVPPDGEAYVDRLLKHAKMAMAEARASGRNAIVRFRQRMADKEQQEQQFASMLRHALYADQFELAFQPQRRVNGPDAVPSVEALLRWRHPERGLIAAVDFLPVAERSGLMVGIGRWVVTAAVTAIARWKAAGMPCRVAINISGQELERPDLAAHIAEWLDRSGVPPELLEIEITETAMTAAEPVLRDRLEALRALGVTIALDDFGTGYSNLSRLTRLPIDRIKIDRSLSALGGLVATEIVECVVRLGKALAIEVVAEGIETPDQARLIADLGCDLLQGYGVSPPLGEPDLLAWLADPAASRKAA